MILKRELYLSKIRPLYGNNLIKALVGPRRSGKSEILKMIRNELYAIGVDEDHMIYISFENVDYDGLLDYRSLNEYVKKLIVDSDKYYLMFDEIQHVNGFEKVLASLKASFDCSIFITGSNSALLKGSLATLLTGRYIEFRVRPFTYRESCEYLTKIGKPIPPDFLEADYLKWGGFPQRFDFDDEEMRRAYLKQLYDDTIDKDVLGATRKDKKKSNLNKGKLRLVASYVLATAGQEFSPVSIERYLQNAPDDVLSISSNTVRAYLSLLENAFVIERVGRFNIKGKRKLIAKPKYYAVDNGIRIVQADSPSYMGSFFLENAVYNELVARGYDVNVGKKHNGEIDFVVSKNGKYCYIQVAYHLTNTKGPDEKKTAYEREYDAFEAIKDGRPRYVFSLDKIDSSHNGITHINIEDYFLGKIDITLS